MGKFLVALFSLVLGIALGVAGIPLALWVALALYRVEVALDWAAWLVERSPLPLYAPAVQVANDALRRDSLIATGLAAAVLCLLAFSLLRSARQALRSGDESHDGKATIQLKTRPLRVGRPVEGSIWLRQGPERDLLYRVELSCRRDHASGRSDRSETAYSEELEVAPVRTPVGLSLPFRFVVPPIAPPSGGDFMSGPGYRWRLAVRRSQGWISRPSVFALDLAPAPPGELRALERREAGRREPELKRASGGIAGSAGEELALRDPPGLREPAPAGFEMPREKATLERVDNSIARGAREEPILLHERPEFRGGAPDGRGEEGPFWKIVKWTFLLLFGGALAVSAVAVATAVLLRYVM